MTFWDLAFSHVIGIIVASALFSIVEERNRISRPTPSADGIKPEGEKENHDQV